MQIGCSILVYSNEICIHVRGVFDLRSEAESWLYRWQRRGKKLSLIIRITQWLFIGSHHNMYTDLSLLESYSYFVNMILLYDFGLILDWRIFVSHSIIVLVCFDPRNFKRYADRWRSRVMKTSVCIQCEICIKITPSRTYFIHTCLSELFFLIHMSWFVFHGYMLWMHVTP